MLVVSMALLNKLRGLQDKTANYNFKKIPVIWSHTIISVILINKDNMQHSYTYIEFWPYLLKALKFAVTGKNTSHCYSQIKLLYIDISNLRQMKNTSWYF
jgi:hypothetical protein